MCGIHFIVSRHPSDVQHMDAMVASARHRGPDQEGIHKGQFGAFHYALGHNRLAIVGGPEFVQPLFNERYVMAINGEIYNHHALANRYGISETQNDSTTLFHLLIQEGPKILEEVNGMFGLIFIDLVQQTILTSRDCSGQKPLYFAATKDRLVMSSECRAIEEVQPLKLDAQQVRAYLNFKYVEAGGSLFEEVRQIGASTYTLWDHALEACEHTLHPKLSTGMDLKTALSHATVDHCLGTGAPALLLSGGMDSSILLHELKHAGINPTAYTFNTGTQDVQYAKKLAKDYETPLVVVEPETHSFNEFIKDIDLPVGDGAFYFNWLMSREIAKKHKVVLSGAGADELFGGYLRHQAYQKYLSKKQFWLIAKPLSYALGLLPKSEPKRRIKRFFGALSSDEKQTFANFRRLNLGIPFSSNKGTLTLKEALNCDATEYLQQDILSLSDQAGMAHSVEFRAPFLDHRLVQKASQLPAQDKLKNAGKHHLKALYQSEKGLSEVIHRKKMGFGIPFHEFFGEDQTAYVNEKLKLLNSCLTSQEIEKIRKNLQTPNPLNSNEWWAVFILLKWLDNRNLDLV